MEESKKEFTSSYTKAQRIMALIAVLVLLSFAVLALLFSVIHFPGSDRLCMGFLLCAIFVPLMLWIWIWLWGQLTHRRTIATITPEKYDNAGDAESSDVSGNFEGSGESDAPEGDISESESDAPEDDISEDR